MTAAATPLSAAGRRRLWLAILPAGLLPAVAAYGYFIAFADSGYAMRFYTAFKICMAIWPLIVVYGWLEPAARPHWRLLMPRPPDLGLGLVAAGIMGGSVFAAFSLTPLGDAVRAHAAPMHARLVDFGVVDRYLPFCTVLALVHSLFEEYYWRWFVYGQLRRLLPETPAIVVGSLMFAGHHYIILSGFFPLSLTLLLGSFVGVAGAAWCWLYRRRGNLAAAWLSHITADVAIFVIGYRLLF